MPPDVPLDPCRQWLGIDAVDLGDHRRVLGVAPDERDPLAVLRAAESRLTALRAVSAGPLEFVRAGFVKRVEAARESVLAEIAASGSRGPEAASAVFRRPPTPSTLAAKPSATPIPPPVPVTLVSPPPVPGPAAPPPADMAAVAFGDRGGSAPIAIRTTIYRKQTPVVGVALVMLGLTGLAGGLAFYALVLKPKQAGQEERHLAEREESKTEDEQGGTTSPGEAAAGRAAAVEDADRPPPRARRRRPRSPGEAEPPPDESAAPARAPAAVVPPTKPRPVAKDVAATPKPAPAMSEEASRALDATLAEALDALRARQDDVVEARLQAAADRARSSEARQRVAGWKLLASSYGKFLESREAALDAVEPGSSYDVQGQKVIVEKVDADTCVFRTTGPPKTVSRERIPAGIVLAIVSKWAGDDADGGTAIAAYHLARQEPDLRRAREQLDKASKAGADVAAFLPLLDDPVLAATAGDAQ